MSTLRLFMHVAKVTVRGGLQQQSKILCLRSAVTVTAQIIDRPNHSHQRSYSIGQSNCRNACRTIGCLQPCFSAPELGRRRFKVRHSADKAGKSDSKSSAAVTEDDIFGDDSKLGLFAKFKLMYKKYWYVLLPVHVITSIGWFGGFYYMSKSGIDVPALLQYIHLSDSIIERVQHSDMGHLAIAYLCYKVATPLRYALTLGGTTVSIKYLVLAGYIKPIPTKNEIMKLYEQKKAIRAAAKAEKAEKSNEKFEQGKNK